MKKTRQSTILWLMLTILCSIFVLASCGGGGGDNNSDAPTPTTKLTAPTVVLTDDIATWSADASADKFEISIDGNLSYIENSVTSRKLTDGQIFKIRAIGDGTNYTNSDWSNSVTYELPPISKYTITWKNGDTVLKTDTEVSEGTVPTYDGVEPTKASDAQYSYHFAGWTPEVVTVNGDVTYTAVFTPVLNKYTVTWKNGEEIIEIDQDVEYGTIPVYDSATPTKNSTAQFSYEFSGWDKEISTVTGNVTYNAEFSHTANSYAVIFYDETGKIILSTVMVEYGQNAEYPNELPTKPANSEVTYVFDKWVTEVGGNNEDDLSHVVESRNVYASFKTVQNVVDVNIIVNDNSFGSVTVATLKNIPCGAEIVIDENKIIIAEQVVEAVPMAKTPQYTYAFSMWNAEDTVGADTIIEACFTRTVNTYKVIWKNGDEVLETDENVEYGTTPIYNGEIPVKKATEQINYTFNGWSPAVSVVTGDAVYEAQFVDATNKYTVTFYDEEGEAIFGVATVEYGETALFFGDLPKKPSTEQYEYTFVGWVNNVGSNEKASLENITSNKSVYAAFSSSLRMYKVTFRDFDGTIISTQTVEYRDRAVEPEEPSRQDYAFKAWDTDFDTIVADTIVTAKYGVEVQFLDYDGKVMKSEIIDVECGIQPPQAIALDGYEFVGWALVDKDTIIEDFTSITSNLTVYAKYLKLYTVRFEDYDGTILMETVVREGEGALAPELDPKRREGYTFKCWDKVVDSVVADMTINAVYEINKYTVTFVMPDGKVVGEEKNIKHGMSVIPPIVENILFEETTKLMAYRFTGWSLSTEEIVEDMTVTACYDERIIEPVIVVMDTAIRVDQTEDIYVSVYICAPTRTLSGMCMNFEYDENLILNSIKYDTDIINEDKGLCVTRNDKDNQRLEMYWLHNSDESDGLEISDSMFVLTFKFGVNDPLENLNGYVVKVLEDCYLIDENLTKIIPIVVSGEITVKAD